MKKIFFTLMGLFLSVQFGWTGGKTLSSHSYFEERVARRVLDALSDTTTNTRTYTGSAKTVKKSVSKTSKKRMGQKSRSLRHSKNDLKNQAALALHKNKMLSGDFVEKGAVQFFTNQSAVRNMADFNKILHLADQLIFNASLQVSIAGYTDNRGDAAYNDLLSYQRAKQVRDYLLELGVPDAQIHFSFDGMADPAAGNDSPEGRAENRRVEFVLFAAAG